MQTVVLSGGVGAARFLAGLVQTMDESEITVISNTGDDSEFYGLYVCPDIDIVIYTLAGMVNPETGWGLEGDTFSALKELDVLGCETWFGLGDRDFATHIWRTARMRQGDTLSEITRLLASARGLGLQILPMSDERVRTMFDTQEGLLPFQDYMVKRRSQPKVAAIRFEGAKAASPARGVVESIESARRIILAPSNPYISIGSILAVPGIREALRRTPARVAAISPIVEGKAVKGPAAKLMQEFGVEVSPFGVAQLYKDFLDLMIIDEQDAAILGRIEDLGIKADTAQTMMHSPQAKKTLAQRALERIDALK